MSEKIKDLKKKCAKYAREAKRLNVEIAKRLQSLSSEMAAGAMSSIHEAAKIDVEPYALPFLKGRRSGLTASEQKRLAPTKYDKMERHLLKLFAGWSIGEIEPLLINRVLPEVKRRAKVPK